MIFNLYLMKLIKDNINIYDNDSSNNYKTYYINYLEIKNKMLEFNTNIIELNENNYNYIIYEYDIKKDEIK